MTLSGSFDIASSGLSTQSERMKLSANNIANLNTPYYVRKIPVLSEREENSFEDIIGSMRNGVITSGIAYHPGGVTLAGVIEDPTPAKKVYNPNHPQADKNGYVALSTSNILADMADAMSTQRLYEANLSVVGIVKAMANRAIEIGRGQ